MPNPSVLGQKGEHRGASVEIHELAFSRVAPKLGSRLDAVRGRHGGQVLGRPRAVASDDDQPCIREILTGEGKRRDEIREPPPVEQRSDEEHDWFPCHSLARADAAVGDSRRNHDDARRVDAEARLELRPGELRVGEYDGRGMSRAAGEPSATESFPGAEPLWMRHERDVVDGYGTRDRNSNWGRVGGREEGIERIAADGSPEMGLLPPRPSPGAGPDQSQVDRAGRKGERQRLGRVEDESPACRVVSRRPPDQQLSQIAPDARRLAEELPGVDANNQRTRHDRDRRLATADL